MAGATLRYAYVTRILEGSAAFPLQVKEWFGMIGTAGATNATVVMPCSYATAECQANPNSIGETDEW